MPLSPIRAFLRPETAGGLLLVAAAVAAMIFANSPFSHLYTAFLDTPMTIRVGSAEISHPLLHWVNDGLMAVFFLLVGLEIKREVMAGELSSPRKAALPLVAAIGGMVVPALVYVAATWPDAAAMRGWAIPAATDIAFALGVLALLGDRAPSSLRIFLLALAIIDDLGAIIIIALFFTAQLSMPALVLAACALAVLAALNMGGVTRLAPYIVTGILLWSFVLESGVHATLAGVALGFAIPLRARDPKAPSPLKTMEHDLHPWVTFGILPLFAFANAGIPLDRVGLDTLTNPVTLGVMLGLFVGKQAGVMAATLAAARLGIGIFPAGASLRQFHGMAVLTGIGFTMSLFIGTLAFPEGGHDTAVRLGVLGGSLLSAVLGYALLSRRSAPVAP
ncbi:Na+/H+ antiporter NhaA [Magnetospirillum sp. SS-4]|uniref:Na+/H+ antiporter NhaA n=1 Tax=Magnetospirillum sp. SS-4 TaxID=2681465 RepID=UPI001384C572|nr:Na+/H+ antiporter NhaA [Magnetospirillum sp. SS-4]CAA7619281.1 sodium-proton antiporter [Magnetospirillum sp. SS-4]